MFQWDLLQRFLFGVFCTQAVVYHPCYLPPLPAEYLLETSDFIPILINLTRFGRFFRADPTDVFGKNLRIAA